MTSILTTLYAVFRHFWENRFDKQTVDDTPFAEDLNEGQTKNQCIYKDYFP